MTTDHDLHGYRNEMGPCVCANCEANRKEFAVVTARADAAERMLGHVIEVIEEDDREMVFVDVPGVHQWWETYCKGIKAKILTADLARLDAERERVARELAAITASASPAS